MGAGSQDQIGRAYSASYTHTPSFGSSHSSLSADHAPSASYTHTPSFSSSHSFDAAPTPPEEAILIPHPPPSPWHPHAAASVTGFALAQGLYAGGSLQEIDGRSVRVENLHVHFHNQYAVGGIREEYEKHLSTNSNINCPGAAVAANHPADGNTSSRGQSEPCFALASCAEGINFGRKFMKGFYRAVKHVDKHRHLISYTQSPSITQTLSLALSLGLSTKRAKHVIFLFDSGPPQHLAHAWPLHIHLRDIASLIQSLGASFEYTRAKVKKNRFSLYIFAIKQRGTRFSSEGMQTWAGISYWAQNLSDSEDNGTVSSFLSSLGSFQGASF